MFGVRFFPLIYNILIDNWLMFKQQMNLGKSKIAQLYNTKLTIWNKDWMPLRLKLKMISIQSSIILMCNILSSNLMRVPKLSLSIMIRKFCNKILIWLNRLIRKNLIKLRDFWWYLIRLILMVMEWLISKKLENSENN